MHAFLFDASALIKRYAPEVGAAVVDYLFAQVGHGRLLCLMLGVAEVSAALVRKRNSGSITSPMFAAAMTQLRMEVLMAADFIKLPADNALIATAIPLAEKHAINATDAIVLQTALTITAQRRATGDDLVLVASDQRLLRAAQAEGVFTFNPETQTETDYDAFLRA